jgi:hypothetical protein
VAIDQARIDRLWREWRVGRPQYASKEEETERRANFVLHVASADNVRHKIRDHPHLDEDGLQNHFNHFADWTRKDWESVYRKKIKKREKRLFEGFNISLYNTILIGALLNMSIIEKWKEWTEK